MSSSIFERVQIDLIDMRNQPDGEFNWIGHMEDHNGQFHVIWAQKRKEGNNNKKKKKTENYFVS